MAIAGSAASSVYMTLRNGRLHEGSVMLRQWSLLCETPLQAWERLKRDGECYMWLHGSNLMELRAMASEWVEANEQA